MKSIYKVLLMFIVCIILQSPQTKAQVFFQDSMAVVDMYNSTNGSMWFNNTNWLSPAPMQSWHGITIVANRVDKIELPNNNLTGNLPSSMVDLLAIDVIDLEDNYIEDLSYLGGGLDASLINVRNNNLCFDDLELNFMIQSTFWYDPQRIIGLDTMVNANKGSSYTLDVDCGGFSNLYQWYKNGMPIGTPSTTSSHTLMNLDLTDVGNYHCEVTNTTVTGMSIFSRVTTLNISPCVDSLGGEYQCNQLVVHFNPNTSSSTKHLLRNKYSGTLVDSCLCNEFEIWEFPDSVDLEPRKKVMNDDSDMDGEGIDFNYIINLDENLQADPIQGSPTLPGPAPTGNPVLVAIIDSGISYSHDSLRHRIWKNMPEINDGFDNDGNCLVDDQFGWDFVLDSPNADDDNGHGTFIAGIITNNDNAENEIQLLNIKAFTEDKGSLFDVLCALKYGESKGAKVYNLSFGYYGEPSLIMENIMKNATVPGGCSKPIYVASAGNDTLDNDIFHHYPSDYTLDNLIAVSAMDSMENYLASFSNWGKNSVDLAALGENIRSTFPPNAMAIAEGTSYAAPQVVRAIARSMVYRPGISHRGAKASVLTTTTPITGGMDSLQTGGKLDEMAAVAQAITGGPEYFDCVPRVEIKVLLEGPLMSTLLMHDSLRTQMHIPLAQPFNTAPWDYAGPEVTTAAVLGTTGSDAIVDWVLIMAFDTLAGDTLYQACLLQSDGDVIDANGFPVLLPVERDLHVAIIHRNHLAIRTENLISFTDQPTVIDLTDGSIDIGTIGVKTIDGKLVMMVGDANEDGIINMADFNQWNLHNGAPFNYLLTPTDFNMDGSINATDKYDYLLPNFLNESACEPCYD